MLLARMLAEGRAVSTTVPEGANSYGMEFGAANVALHEVSAAIELADGTLAVSRAERAERAGHLRCHGNHIDLPDTD